MSMKPTPVSWWEVAEMVYERRNGWSWEAIGFAHGISDNKAKREVKRFRRMWESRRDASAHGKEKA